MSYRLRAGQFVDIIGTYGRQYVSYLYSICVKGHGTPTPMERTSLPCTFASVAMFLSYLRDSFE